MKKLLGIALGLLLFTANAQQSANSWIDFSQDYYKFKIAEDGLYRINRQTLIASNIPINTIDPRNFQLFSKGKEIPIFLSGESDGIFDTDDYIEFYALANDGWLDTVFYRNRARQPNPYYSLLNDTLSYYLTWNNSTDNLRFKEENNINFSNYFAAPYVWKEQVQSFQSNYFDGEITTGGGNDVEYVPSEGWMDSPLSLAHTRNYLIASPNRYSAGPFVEFEAQIAGESDWGLLNNGDHHLQLSIGSLQFDRIFEGYELIRIQESFSPTELISGNNTITIKSIDDLSTNPNRVDRTALAYLKLTYPHSLNFENSSFFEFLLDDSNSQNAQYLEITNFNGGSSPVLYDLTNNKRVEVVETIASYKTIIPNGGNRKRCILAATNEIKTISRLAPVNGTGRFTDFTAQVADSVYVIVTHQSIFPEATTYAAYRESTGLSTLIAQIDELYDQFGFGIDKNPLAIRNFIDIAFNDWLFPPTHLFLLGKSVNLKDHRKNASNYAKNLVPTMGNPATDNLLISGLQGTNLEPVVPIGRLSAKNLNEVDIYLDKVIEYESAPAALWMKKALHFAGGKSGFEANRHEIYLNGFSQDFQSAPLGGETQLFKKSSSAPYQVSLADSIRILINEGVSLLTFFGHSAATGGFDISIDSPNQFQNRGKYHVLLANSCFAGNTHQANVLSTSEQFILERNKGAIAFIASGNLGFALYLNQYSSAFYNNFANQNYGRSLAENMRQTVLDIQTNNPPDPLKNVCLEMTMQGDPALVLNAQNYADFKITADAIMVSPEDVTTDLDSFQVKILIENIGRAVNDSLFIRLSRKFPNQSKNDSIILKKLAPVYYDRFLEFSFPTDILNGVGENKFTLVLDPFNEIEELNENNNRLEFEVLIRSGEIIPVYPYNYSIVGEQSPILKASTAFAFEREKQYIFELDTSAAFNSFLKATETILSSGGVIEWQPSQLVNMPDSAVYFWRVSKVPAPNEAYDWRTFSFQYISGESGWAQDHFDQFEKNNYLFLKRNKPNHLFEFSDNVKELLVKTIGNPTSTELNDILYAIDADTRERGSCFPSPAFLIAVMDSLNLDSWGTPFNGLNPQNDFGQANVGDWCGVNRDRSELVFNFQSRDTTQMFAMRDFLNNSIPDGAYVAVYNWFNIDFDAINAMDSSILKAFEKLGSNLLQTIPNEYPFIITGQMGNTSFLQEKMGDSTRSKIEIRRTITTSADYGTMLSQEIGPSTNFEGLNYRFSSLEQASQDKVLVKVIGISESSSSQELFSSTGFKFDTIFSGFSIPDSIRELKLELQVEDRALQTPPQLQRWQVSHSEYPDAALSPNLFYSQNKDSLQQGENLAIEVAVKNVSSTSIDSIEVFYKVLTSTNKIIEVGSEVLYDLIADSFIVSSLNLPTAQLTGTNKLLIELNPEQVPKEKYTFNNFGQLDFFVSRDNLNPLIDVTFDGRRIINREIVSSTPQIQISLTDENEFLAIDDTSSFALYLRRPNGTEELLNFGSNGMYNLQFKAASLPDNKARVIYKPSLTDDGIYQLRVQAKDKSGNASGDQDFRIEFEVVTKSSITKLLNYPNPFSTSTRFVFTLTGNQIPDQLLIQIMTVTGKVVREIDQYELGPIHIGSNITEFAWDGKDEFGDQLANGVYLYRVKVKSNGNNIDLRESKADRFFTKDYGKMYLLR